MRKWNRAYYETFKDPEVLSSIDKVERSGYRSIADQVKPMLQAGIRLSNHRKGLYQYENGEDDEIPVYPMQSDVFETIEASRKLDDNMQKSLKKKQDENLEIQKEIIGREWAEKNSPPSAEEPIIKP